KVNQAVPVSAHFAGNGAVEFREVCAFGLRDVEDVYDPEADQNRYRPRVPVALCVLRGVGSPATVADHRSENLDALLAPFNEPAKFAPCAVPGDVRCRGVLPRNGKNVAKAVIVEA